MLSQAPINPWTVEFRDRATEAEFRRWRGHDAGQRVTMLGAIVIAAVMFFTFDAYLKHGAGEVFFLQLGPRIALILASVLMIIVARGAKSHRPVDICVLLTAIILALQLFSVSLVGRDAERFMELHYIVTILAIYAFVPNRFVYNLIACLVLSALHMVDVFVLMPQAGGDHGTLVAWTVIANLLGIVTGQRMARMRRRIFIEFSQQQTANVALRLAKERAEYANRSKTEFLANISHELRTPLNAINGFSELMLKGTLGPIGDPRYREYIKDINEAGQHLLHLITEILDYSKIEAGKRTLNEETIEVARLFEDSVRIIRQRAQENGIRLQTEVAPDLPQLRADPLALKQALLNLLTNAVKFTPSGGTVTLAARHDANGFCLSVTDTGVGMSEEDIEIALTPFGQIESAMARSHEGTGLGLPLTKALTELHGGTLEFESGFGAGTRVTIRLPADRAVGSRSSSISSSAL